MLAALNTAYADTRADALTFALGLPPIPALAVLPLERAGLNVELRLLGASHQVLAGPISETVACLPDRSGPLPGTVRKSLDGWSYDFTAVVETYDGDAAFGRSVELVRAMLADRTDALTGAFPGSPYAVTALVCDEPADGGQGTQGIQGLGWRTWHAYPQTREIVITRTRLEARP